MNSQLAHACLLIVIAVALQAAPTAAQPSGGAPGAQLFAHHCAPCHGKRGEGNIGPSLQLMRDQTEVEQIVSQGRGGAMPAFRFGLSTDQIAAVAGFVVNDIARDGIQPEQERPKKPVIGDTRRGMAFFTGDAAFSQGAPPCIACHDVKVQRIPPGGTLGPVLTEAYGSYGAALINILEKIPFPTMAPIYLQHPLTLNERQDLEAFFSTVAAPQGQPRGETMPFVIFALIGCGALFGLTWIVWPRRLRSARRDLLASTRREKGKTR